MELAIIIPAKNEEKALPYLLNSIKKQTFKDFKIFVADANSKDKTKQIAKKYKCEIVKGGLPSIGKNNGTKKALKQNFDILAFVDADIILPSKDFLEKAIKEFKKRDLDLAGTLQIPFNTKSKSNLKKVIETTKKTKDWKYLLTYKILGLIFKLMQNSKSPFMATIIFEKKEVFKKIGGFDEELEFGEDSAYSKYAIGKGYKFGL